MAQSAPPSPTTGYAFPVRDALITALSADQQLWRGLAMSVGDIIFETDGAGSFTYLHPTNVIGWQTSALIGASATCMLPSGINLKRSIFGAEKPERATHCWLRSPSDTFHCFLMFVFPIHGSDGGITGRRGLGIDVTTQVRQQALVARESHHAAIITQLSRILRNHILPRHGMPEALKEFAASLGATGGTLHSHIAPADDTNKEISSVAVSLRINQCDDPAELQNIWDMHEPLDTEHEASIVCCDVHHVILARVNIRFLGELRLTLWRPADNVWREADLALVNVAMATFATVLELDAVHSMLIANTAVDFLTGLPDTKGFLEEATRRLDRLDREHNAATVMVVGIDDFSAINKCYGREAGDTALKSFAVMLRNTVRPTDIVARLGSDIFAIWLDTADQFASAERAEIMCQHGAPFLLSPPVRNSVSVGFATREIGSDEDVQTVLERARLALLTVKNSLRGRWLFSNEGN